MPKSQKEILDFLAQFVSEHKKQKMIEVLAQRTRHLTVVLENIHKPRNASAVVRSCDCFGIQDLHIIDHYNHYEVNPYVSMGSAQWVNLQKYSDESINNTEECFARLKKLDYKIYATSPLQENTLDIARNTVG